MDDLDEILAFIRERGLDEDQIKEIEKNKIDSNVILMMDDKHLKAYVPAYGDRVALRQFCRRKEPKSKQKKSALFQKLKRKLKRNNTESDSDSSDDKKVKHPLFGNKNASKKIRRVDIGWLNYDESVCDFKQVKEKRGGGIRRATLDKDTTMAEILKLAISLFFPNGKSPLGELEDFEITLHDFKQCSLEEQEKLGDIYDTTRVKLLRLYICTRLKDNHSIELVKPKKRMKKPSATSTICTNPTDPTVTVSGGSESYSSKAFQPQDLMQPSSTNSTVFTSSSLDLRFMCTETEIVTTSENSIAQAELLDLSEVQFGPTDTVTADMLSETVPLSFNTLDLPDSPRGPSPPTFTDNDGMTLHPSIHRVNLMEELIAIFKAPEIMNLTIKYNFVGEEGADLSGISRDVYTSFWSEFVSRHAEGEDTRVPALNPKWQLEEWKAIGRILLKGYQDLRYFPLQLAQSFTLALIHGEHVVSSEISMSSFMQYLSKMDRDTLNAVLNDDLPTEENDNYIDILDRFGYTCVPKKEEVKHTLLQIAHKELIQRPKYALDAMISVARSGLALFLPDKDAVDLMYSSQTPTVRKILKLLKAEPSNNNEAACFGYLQAYIKALSDPVRLRSFLQFVTGSDVLCVDKIDIMFNTTTGLKRSPVAHTCGPTLEIPSTYQSYPEFRGEFDSILHSKDCLMFGFA